MDTFTVEDLMASAVAQKPGEFEEAFQDIILNRIGLAVEERKFELAQTMFNEKCREEEEEGGKKHKKKREEEEEEEE